jgi:transcriptional regulator with XRE-family HTH domain
METLRRLRTERGLSQARLAARAELDPSTVNQIERGAREASPATLHKLAAALDVGLYELLEGEPSPKALRRSSPEPSLFNGGEEERRASLRSWVGFAGRLADRWAEEIEEREGRSSTASSAVKKHVMMLPNLHWAVEITDTYTDVVEAVATDPNYVALVYSSEEVRELYAATTRMKEAVDHTRDWFPSRQEDPKMAEVIDLRRAAIERAEKRLGTRAS